MESRKSWFEQNSKKTYLLIFVVFLLFLEVSLRLLVRFGVVQYHLYPTRSSQQATTFFMGRLSDTFGIWHHPNVTARHQSSCFDVTYQSNSHGMRDKERSFSSSASRRVVVLGDSFVEGLGVGHGDRLTDILEERTGIEHLNFGSSGDFGSIIEWVLYRDLASKFDHSDVFIFMLPFNDFKDNDPDVPHATTFRPYLKNEGGVWNIYYTEAFGEPEGKRHPALMSQSESIRNSFNNMYYTANVFRRALRILKIKLNREEFPATYNSCSDSDLEILLHSYGEIARLAYPRKVYLFTIPVDRDYMYYEKHGYEFRLVKDLKDFAAGIDNVEYFDLLPAMLKFLDDGDRHYKSIEIPCDGHWNEDGHAMAAEAVMEYIWKK